MMKIERQERYGLPAVHVLSLVELLARRGIAAEQVLEPAHLDVARLMDPRTRVSLPDVERIASRALALTNEPLLGVYLGLQMRASAHGYLGFAAMTSETLREAIHLAGRFRTTRTSAIGLRLYVDHGIGSLVVHERAALGAARELVVLALLVGVAEMGNALTGKRLDTTVEVTFRPPALAGLVGVREVAGVSVHFACPSDRLVFPAEVLDLPVIHADTVARRLAEAECERELATFGNERDFRDRVRAAMARDEDGFRSLAESAVRLGMSTRTLKRRLAEESTDFSKLLEEEQRDRALVLLRTPSLSLEEIAARVGYSNRANFSRAFRRWTGMSPAEYRRRGR